MRRTRGNAVAIYGTVSLVRVKCRRCGYDSFVRDGETLCCLEPIGSARVRKYTRECEAVGHKRKPMPYEQADILLAQDHRCFYCRNEFGSAHLRIYGRRGVREIVLTVHWDHKVPHAYLRDNNAANFVASCQVCNIIKGDLFFEDMEQAKAYLEKQRARLGYNF